jgi:hypothetical protein
MSIVKSRTRCARGILSSFGGAWRAGERRALPVRSNSIRSKGRPPETVEGRDGNLLGGELQTLSLVGTTIPELAAAG